MKTIGLIGGMSWESSLEYYRIVNQTVKRELGGLHSAQCVMVSLDFAAIEEMQSQGRWDDAADALVEAARGLERAGADCVLICTNTMHIVADAVQAGVDLPLIHIADATAEKVQAAGLRRVGLLGTRFTMERDFYKGRLIDTYGLEVLIPPDEGRRVVDDVIYNELVLGVLKHESRARFRAIIADLVADGAEGIILGCTEIPMLVKPEDSAVPLFDTTLIHAQAAVEFALGE
jgi:aspartate racemase